MANSSGNNSNNNNMKADVKGRMITESNPDKKRMPAFPAQYFDKDEYSTIVNEENPYPVGNFAQNKSGIWLPVSHANPMPTQLTGSNVDLRTVSTTPFYQRGIEFLDVNLEQNIEDSDGNPVDDSAVFTFNDNHINLYAAGQAPHPNVYLVYNVDLTEISSLLVDWESVQGDSSHERFRIYVGSDRLLDIRSIFSKSYFAVDVSELTGVKEIKVGFNIGTTSGKKAELNVHGIWGVK